MLAVILNLNLIHIEIGFIYNIFRLIYDDKNLFAIFTTFISPVWIFIGVFMLSKDVTELAVLLIFTAVITMALLANWQYKNRKKYKLLDIHRK